MAAHRPLNILTGNSLLRGLKIGLLGGSFNPAHNGHLHISLEALKRLGLDQVWWLVSPQNPLKATGNMAEQKVRLKRAKGLARHPRLRVFGFEAELGTRYTIDTLALLTRFYPETRFVWLMGADNMVQLPHWKHWRRIINIVPIAILDRPNYSYRAGLGKAAQIYRRNRLPEREARRLASCTPPKWVFCHIPRSPLSATDIRAGKYG